MLEPPSGEERMRLVGDLVEHATSRRTATRRRRRRESLRVARRRPGDHQQARRGARLRRAHPVPRRADPWLAEPRRGRRLRHREGQKLVKLVEATARRPADADRQLRRAAARPAGAGRRATCAGAEQTQFADVLQATGRRGSTTITLEDRNLPTIAEKPLLRPTRRGGAAADRRGFRARRERARQEVIETLLTDAGRPRDVPKVYPFSPALVRDARRRLVGAAARAHGAEAHAAAARRPARRRSSSATSSASATSGT